MLKNRNVPAVPVTFVEGRSIYLPEIKWEFCQFLVTHYPADLEKSAVVAAEEQASNGVFARDLDDDADWDSDYFRGVSNLGSRTNIHLGYWRLHEVCSVVIESFPSSVADLLSLKVRGMEAMSRASILEVHVGTLESTLSSKNTRFGKLKSQPASKD